MAANQTNPKKIPITEGEFRTKTQKQRWCFSK